MSGVKDWQVRWYSRHVSRRLAIVGLLLLSAGSLAGQQLSPNPVSNSVTNAPATLVIQGLGRGVMPLDGNWQFHTGDDLRWAAPAFDDSGWEAISTEEPWGAQGHPSYPGFAWYRRHVEIMPTAGSTHEYRLLIPHAEDAYEVYWNGVLLGSCGKLPPNPSWYYNQPPRSFPLTGSALGVLAIRVWKAPLDAFAFEEGGGLYAAPLVGDPDSIALNEGSIYWTWVREDLFDYSLVMLRAFVTVLCLVFWARNRKERFFVWVAVFTATPVALEIIQRLFIIPFSYEVARLLNQPLYVLNHIALWFLLVYLLRLNERRRLFRFTKLLAGWTFAAGLLDGLLASFWGSAGTPMQWADGILSTFIIVVEAYPIVLVGIGFGNRLTRSRWVVAICALLSLAIDTIANASALGQRFTHFAFFQYIIDTPLTTIQGVQFRAEKILSIVLFGGILYAVYRFALEQQSRQNVLEQEMQSAREIQQVLIPEKLPSLKGYAMTSAYQPAQEVGGDFFQILSNLDGSAIVALGDVSGKGLKAAMNVSMIVGVLRALADNSTSPAELLGGLNRCLCGRMQGGFTTGVILRLDTDGTVTIANAGHLPPFLNREELQLEGSLPLGLMSFAVYDETTLQMEPGDHLSLYTDGLLEARNEDGELFGFDRLHDLLANRPTALVATEAAVAFGQDDDITVLTLTRLAEGEESTTSLATPLLKTVVAGRYD